MANDLVWAKYVKNVQNDKPLAAASWAAGTLALGGFNIISYAHDSWALIPAIAGAFLGTFLIVRSHRKKYDEAVF